MRDPLDRRSAEKIMRQTIAPDRSFLCPRRDEFAPDGIPSGMPKTDTWLREYGYRTCSWCGSMHPEDFMRICRSGSGEVGPTDKRYKAYVEGGIIRAKFYFRHLTEDQRREFVDLYNDRAVRRYDSEGDYEVIRDRGSKLKIGYPGRFYVLPYFMAHR